MTLSQNGGTPQRNNRRRLIWLATVLSSLGVGALLLHAFNPQPDPPGVYGLVGITPFESIRINVTNVASSVGVPPGPCRLQVGFVNADGVLLKSAQGVLADGHSVSLAMNFSEASASATDTLALARTRVSVRPVFKFLPPDPCYTGASAELVDTASGRTSLYMTPERKLPAVQASTVPTTN